MDNYINLEKSNVTKIGIKNENGEILKDENGEPFCLTFDFEDIELPLKYEKSIEVHKNNQSNFRLKSTALEKKEDIKAENILSSKDKERIALVKDFYNKEIESLDLFLGEGNTNKILKAMGRKPYYSMFEDITNCLKPIIPLFKNNIDSISSKIKQKYSNNEEIETLE